MNKLYRYSESFGRMGDVESLFIAEESLVEELKGSQLEAGEILGKHSDITLSPNEYNIVEISDDQEKIQWLEDIMGDTHICGEDIVLLYEEQSWEEEDEDEQ